MVGCWYRLNSVIKEQVVESETGNSVWTVVPQCVEYRDTKYLVTEWRWGTFQVMTPE